MHFFTPRTASMPRFCDKSAPVLGLATLALLGLAAVPASAQTVLNFDTASDGTPTVALEAVNTAYPNSGVVFSSNAVIFMGANDPQAVPSPPGFVIPSTIAPITATFDGTVNFVSAANVSNSSFSLTAFDSLGHELGATSVSNGIPDGQVASLSFADIKSVEFDVTASEKEYGFDDFTFQPNTPAAPVPEASTTVSFGMLLALGMGGVIIAKKKKATASV